MVLYDHFINTPYYLQSTPVYVKEYHGITCIKKYIVHYKYALLSKATYIALQFE